MQTRFPGSCRGKAWVLGLSTPTIARRPRLWRCGGGSRQVGPNRHRGGPCAGCGGGPASARRETLSVGTRPLPQTTRSRKPRAATLMKTFGAGLARSPGGFPCASTAVAASGEDARGADGIAGDVPRFRAAAGRPSSAAGSERAAVPQPVAGAALTSTTSGSSRCRKPRVRVAQAGWRSATRGGVRVAGTTTCRSAKVAPRGGAAGTGRNLPSLGRISGLTSTWGSTVLVALRPRRRAPPGNRRERSWCVEQVLAIRGGGLQYRLLLPALRRAQ